MGRNHYEAATPSDRDNSGAQQQQQQQQQQQHQTNEPNLLLTPKAFELSLSPPRAPPFGSVQRALYAGQKPEMHQPWAQHYHVRCGDGGEAYGSWEPHATIRQRITRLWTKKKHNHNNNAYHHHHPHLAEKSADTATRLLGLWWSVERQNRFRDSGTFRLVADGLVTATAPLLAFSSPASVPTFLQLTRQHRPLTYGPHPRQRLDLYLPTAAAKNTVGGRRPVQRLIFFVHGGAWGSGQPWMYRLVAAPYLHQGWAVAVVGYRTYPDGGGVDQQVHDLELAATVLQHQLHPGVMGNTTCCTLMGHSSGAHLALLLLVDRAKEKLTSDKTIGGTEDCPLSPPAAQSPTTLQFDSFVGLSGPYDISHHFDYEAGRGVEELSPMKPVNGYTRAAFRKNSPARRLQDALAGSNSHQEEGSMDSLLPAMALVHGIEDDTVPFTAAAEAARILRSCGLTRVDEIYVPETGHQDMILQIMLGGRARDAIIQWINGLSSGSSTSENVGQRCFTRSKL